MKILSATRLRTLVSHLREEAGQLTFVAAELSARGYQSAAGQLLKAAEDLSAVADTIDPDEET